MKIEPEAAVKSPRCHYQDGVFQLEKGFELLDEERPEFNYWDQQSLYFGGTHCISSQGKTYKAIADERREGFAIEL